ncbi:MAG: vWA domain-containing protein [Planctomycetia bacterium]
MSFAQPWLLLLLIAPAAVLISLWRSAGHPVVLPLDHRFDRRAERRGRWLRFVVNAAESTPALLGAVAILLVAGPQQLGEPESKRIVSNIELCVDVSGSMTSPFGDGSRYDGSMKAIDQFVDFRKGDAFGLTFFGSTVLHWCPLTRDVSAIKCSTPFMRPEQLPYWFGGTMIGQALRACAKLLVEREEGDRMIVLITDGFSADLSGGADMELAAELKKQNIVVFGILVGETDVPDEIVNITELTGGASFQAGDPEALKAVFARIDGMQPAKLKKTIAETKDFFGPFCLAGLTLVGAASLAQFGLRYTPW